MIPPGGAALAAGAAGVLAVLAAWEGLRLLERSAAVRRTAALVDPVRALVRDGRAPDDAERRRLLLLGGCSLLAAGWLLVAPLAGLTAAIALPGAARAAVRARRRRWRAEVGRGAAPAARAMADALGGGHSVPAAIAEAARSGTGSAAADAELARCLRALQLGARVEDALESLRSRAGGPAWTVVVAAVLLQQRAGGDLARLLRQLAGELDAARRDQDEATAATAQARASARVVAGLPVAGAVIAEVLSPGALAPLVASPPAAMLTAAAVALQAGSLLAVRQITAAIR